MSVPLIQKIRVGAYLINFAIVEGFLFIMLMGFIAWKDQNPDAGMTWAIVIGLFIGLIGPVLFYPYSRTIWSARSTRSTRRWRIRWRRCGASAKPTSASA